MTVATILNGKGREVASISDDATVGDVARDLTQKRVGALIVYDATGKMSGIVSERDIIRALAQRGSACLEEGVSSFMTREVVTCAPGDTADSVMRRMTDGRFRHMPVVEDGNLVGIISIGDVVKAHIAEVEMEADALRSYIVSG